MGSLHSESMDYRLTQGRSRTWVLAPIEAKLVGLGKQTVDTCAWERVLFQGSDSGEAVGEKAERSELDPTGHGSWSPGHLVSPRWGDLAVGSLQGFRPGGLGHHLLPLSLGQVRNSGLHTGRM